MQVGAGCAVTALLKVENLKANHNCRLAWSSVLLAVTALLKVENLKANHNKNTKAPAILIAVTALLKVENLKANHNGKAFVMLFVML